MQRDTWVEVRRDALRANYQQVEKHAGVPVCAVVKANAYGHGIAETARIFVQAGATLLGVTRLDEARAIRDGGIDAPILVFTPTGSWEDATALRCDGTVASRNDIDGLTDQARAHLKIDTGMGRLGVAPSDAVEAAEAIARRATLAGVYTHFADGAGSTARAQLDRFNAVLAALRHHGIDAPAHASNSAALLALPQARFDLVRIGTLLYGQDPPGARAPWQHQDTFAWHARVVAVRDLAAGATIGYGSEWRAKKATRVGTIPVGYADGFTVEPNARTPSPRVLAHSVRSSLKPPRSVFFGEQEARVLGRVGMQVITVSLDGFEHVKVGDIARIPARRLMVSPLIERVYA